MAEYRLYCLDLEGRIQLADWIEASGDAEAIEKARDLKKGTKCEVWQRERLVATLDPNGCLLPDPV